MDDNLLPRESSNDPEALQARLQRAAEAIRQEEAKVRRVSGWASLGFALALGVISGCAPTAVYGGPPPTSLTPTAAGTPSTTPTAAQAPRPPYGAAPPAEAPEHR